MLLLCCSLAIVGSATPLLAAQCTCKITSGPFKHVTSYHPRKSQLSLMFVSSERERVKRARGRERPERDQRERERERRERERARKSRTRYLFWLRPFQSFGICCTFDPQATLINHGHFPSKFERAGADIGRKLQTVCHQCRQGRSSQIRGRARLDRQLGRLRCSGVSARRGTLWMKIPLSGALDNLGPPGSPAQAV